MKPDKNPQTPPIPKKIKISEVESPPEADTLDITIHFGDLVVSNRNEWVVNNESYKMSHCFTIN